jgi:peptide chain release factor subunit 1
MSHKRFNRLRRGAIDRFISEIADDLERLEDLRDMRGLVVAGPGKEKKQLLEALPKHMRDKVIGTVDVSIDVPPDRLLARGEEVALAHERAVEGGALEELRTAIFKDELAALGVHEVREALVNGRVDTLLISDHLSIPGWICESCKRIHEGAPPSATCPDCGGPTSRAEIVEELYELAERTDAEVEVIRQSPFLESIGGLAAILRY